MISIIGGGPIGAKLGFELAKKGEEVSIFEEHEKIGEPVQCTGLLTRDIKKYMKIKKEFLVNKIKRIVLHSKKEKTILRTKEYVVDRTRFDQNLINQARRAGARIMKKHKLTGLMNKKIVFNNKKKIDSDIIIGADGPFSKVNELYRINPVNNNYLIGYQKIIETKKEFNPDEYHAHFSEETPHFFTWIVPENNKKIRVGTAVKMGEKNIKKRLDKFIKKEEINGKIINTNSGAIPLFQLFYKVKKKNVYLIGDAARQIKASTGGGIIPGLKAVGPTTKAVMENKEPGINGLRKELFLHLMIRKTLNNLSNESYDEIIRIFKDDKIKRTIKNYSRDNITILLTKIILNKPSVLSSIKFLFKKS